MAPVEGRPPDRGMITEASIRLRSGNKDFTWRGRAAGLRPQPAIQSEAGGQDGRRRNRERAGGQSQAEGGTVTIDTQASDADLIARSLAEPDLFTAVFDRHSGEILRYVYARLGPEVAEDVTAETFLAAFRGRGKYDGAWSDARPWLYGIAVRQ